MFVYVRVLVLSSRYYRDTFVLHAIDLVNVSIAKVFWFFSSLGGLMGSGTLCARHTPHEVLLGERPGQRSTRFVA